MNMLLAAMLAFVPAVVVYVRGRQIARFVDDPALPERLFARSQVTRTSVILTIIGLVAFTGRASIWAVPLMAIAYYAAALPVRRTLFGDTWSLAVYLSFVIRWFVAFWGFWLLVCALPALTLSAGSRGWIVALAIGAALFVLAARQTEVIRWLIGAKTIADATLRARFERLAATAGLPMPHFEAIDLKGGNIVNAFALPSHRQAAVVFTGPLLDRLDADEVDAICAHELAHLEYYSPRRLAQRRLLSRSLIVIGALVVPLVQLLAPSAAWLVCTAWPAIVIVAVAFMAQDRQKHETASDLRAVALTGNPEALVRGLVKIHALARVPRRWDADIERHMSHPSLKRRIQDIRAAAGTPPAALGDRAVFETADGALRVIFGDEQLEWIDGTSATYRLRYDRLTELRLAATRTGETSLLASDRTGHRLQMPLRVDDVPRLQAVLDIVDSRVGTTGRTVTIQPILIQAVTLAVFVVSVNSGLIAVAMVLGMTMWRPDAPLLGAAGIAAIVGALLTWREPATIYGFIPDEFHATFAAVLLVGGVLLVWLAYTRRREEIPPRAWKMVGVVAAAAVAAWVLPLLSIAGRGLDAVGVHQSVREWPSTIVLPLAFAGAMMWSARKEIRLASAAAAVVASAAATVAGSQTFLDRFGGDLFLVPAPDMKVRTLDHPVNEFTVPFGVSTLHLSPSGRSIAAVTIGRSNRASIQIGHAGGPLTSLDADGVLFLDDDRVLVWTVDGSRTELREALVTAPDAARWRLQVPGLPTPAVSVEPRSQRWRLASRAGASAVEAREGVVGTDRIDSYRWTVPESHGSLMPIAITGNRALAVEPRLDLAGPMTDPLGAFVFVLASGPRWRSTLWALGPDGARDLGTSRLELECRALADRGACQVFDASRTRFVAMNAATGSIDAVAALPGRFVAGDETQGGWITGWHRSDLVAVRMAPAEAIRIAGPDGARPHMLAVSDRVAAGVWRQITPASSLRVEPIYQTTGTSLIRIYPLD